LGFESSCCLGIDVTCSCSGVAATAEDTAVLWGVCVVWVGEGVYWSDVVDGVSFSATDRAGGVVFEELFAYAFVST
jgi:hypothetical protein